jgi:hypothetical protein
MTWRTPKAFVLIAVALVCVAVLGSIALAYPRTVSNPALGADWQCRKAIFMTTCSRISRIEPALLNRYRDDVIDIRRV